MEKYLCMIKSDSNTGWVETNSFIQAVEAMEKDLGVGMYEASKELMEGYLNANQISMKCE